MMRIFAGFPPSYWVYCVDAFCYIRNLIPNNMAKQGEDEMSPFERWHGHSVADFGASIKHLRVLGCTAYVFIPKARRLKGDKKCLKGIFMGYCEEQKAYKILVNNKILEARSVYFNETEFQMRKLSDYETEDHADEQLMRSFKRSLDDILLEEFACEQDKAVVEREDRKVDGQGSGSDEEKVTEEENLFGNSTIRDKEQEQKRAKEIGKEMGYDTIHKNISNAEMRRKAMKFMEKDAIREIVSDHMAELEIDSRGVERGGAHTRRELKGKGLRGYGENLPLTHIQISQAQGLSAANLVVSQSKVNKSQTIPTYFMESEEMRVRREAADHGTELLLREALRKNMESQAQVHRQKIGVGYGTETAHGLITRLHGADVPKTRTKMLRHSQSHKFIEGEKKELDSLRKMNAWELVDLPKGKRLMESGWVYDVKTGMDGEIIHKSRFVAKGYSQVYGMDYFEVFSPTMQIKTFRTLLALHSGERDINMECWDVSSAFLFAPMEEEVYIRQPRGYEKGQKVMRLLKSLYGLKQSSRNWSKTVKAAMLAVGFKQSENDACLYIYEKGEAFIHAVIHVDDFAIFNNDQQVCDCIYAELNKHFTLKKGELHHFLGMRVTRNKKDMTLTLDQEEYAVSVLERFDMTDCRSVVCPEEQTKLSMRQSPMNSTEEDEMKDVPYAQLVGCIQYLVVCTRPDLAHAASQISRFMQNPGKEHWKAAKRVLRYLTGTLRHKLCFQPSRGDAVLVGFRMLIMQGVLTPGDHTLGILLR